MPLHSALVSSQLLLRFLHQMDPDPECDQIDNCKGQGCATFLPSKLDENMEEYKTGGSDRKMVHWKFIFHTTYRSQPHHTRLTPECWTLCKPLTATKQRTCMDIASWWHLQWHFVNI